MTSCRHLLEKECDHCHSDIQFLQQCIEDEQNGLTGDRDMEEQPIPTLKGNMYILDYLDLDYPDLDYPDLDYLHGTWIVRHYILGVDNRTNISGFAIENFSNTYPEGGVDTGVQIIKVHIP